LLQSGILNVEEILESEVFGSESEIRESDLDTLCAHQILMEKYCKQKHPAPMSTNQPNKRWRLNDDIVSNRASTTIEHLPIDQSIVHHNIRPQKLHNKSEMREVVENIILDFTMTENEEQQQALRIIADHFIYGTDDQLLMYIGGMGGTGKSHIIEAIIELFRQCGYSEKLLVSAATGCAAVLINGYTIHALTFLPSNKASLNQEELEKIWKHVQYLIIDEVSMISAYFLGQVSERIGRA
jgi:hypothetical protein